MKKPGPDIYRDFKIFCLIDLLNVAYCW